MLAQNAKITASVDGASFWQKLFKITLPLVAPSLTVSTVLNIIYVFNSFPIVWTISKGAPADQTHTLVTYQFTNASINPIFFKRTFSEP